MKVRIKFTKNESIKFLGHLDIMRAFQKCLIRADVKMIYSEGFNPHQKISFALPLSVGMTSEAEYMDALIEDGQNISKIKDDLNKVSGSGFDIININVLKDDATKVMAAVRYADFDVFNFPFELSENDVDSFLLQHEILANKKTKKGIKEENIRPHIINMKCDNNILHLKLKAGSENNLRPDILLNAFFDFCSIECDINDLEIIRKELYSDDFIPLDKMDILD